MNCDQVFDILTRGPFPTGTWCDEPVEAHLEQCAECHRLAEALRPAVELFQEAVDPEESRDLPGYFRAALAESSAPALSYAGELDLRPSVAVRQPPIVVRRSFSAVAAWRMAAMIAIGITAGTLFSTRMDRFDWPPRGSQAAVAPAGDTGPDASATDWEALAWLPASCFRPASGQPLYRLPDAAIKAHAELKDLGCCTGCHNSQSETAGRRATLLVAKSCGHCHDQPPERLSLTN